MQEFESSNPSTGYWIFFTLVCSKICIICLKRPKINYKEAKDVPFKNILLLVKANKERTRNQAKLTKNIN